LSNLSLSDDLSVITAEINSYKQIVGQGLYEMASRIRHVKESDLVHGEWEKWCREKINMTPQHANRFVRISERFANRTSMFELGVAVLNELVDFTDEQISSPQTIPSTGEQKAVDEMTVRELREVKKTLKEAEEELRNRPVVEKIVVKEDKFRIESLQREVERLRNNMTGIEQEKQKAENKLREQGRDIEQVRKLKKEIEDLNTHRSDLSRQIESATALSGLYIKIQNLLKTELAPIRYSRALMERKDSVVAMQNLMEIVTVVEDWCEEMRMHLPKNYIDVEVVNR
jgi:chromosome segregation ATPase